MDFHGSPPTLLFFFSLLLLLLQRREHYHRFIPGNLRVCNKQAQFS